MPPGSTKPDAGVIATRPATAPEMQPRTEGLPLAIRSAGNAGECGGCRGDLRDCHPRHAGAAIGGNRRSPALKPNQPTHKKRRADH